MKVLRLHGGGDLRLHDEPEPVPGPGEALLRVTAVGLCGSDLHWFAEAGIGDEWLARPLVLGHEFAGVIESDERYGQRVAVDPAVPCGACEFCLEGNPNFCDNLIFAGHGSDDGALREVMAWPARNDGLPVAGVTLVQFVPSHSQVSFIDHETMYPPKRITRCLAAS